MRFFAVRYRYRVVLGNS